MGHSRIRVLSNLEGARRQPKIVTLECELKPPRDHGREAEFAGRGKPSLYTVALPFEHRTGPASETALERDELSRQLEPAGFRSLNLKMDTPFSRLEENLAGLEGRLAPDPGQNRPRPAVQDEGHSNFAQVSGYTLDEATGGSTQAVGRRRPFSLELYNSIEGAPDEILRGNLQRGTPQRNQDLLILIDSRPTTLAPRSEVGAHGGIPAHTLGALTVGKQRGIARVTVQLVSLPSGKRPPDAQNTPRPPTYWSQKKPT